MRARIHRGAREVGGSCVELEAKGRRLVLDIGRPLWAEPADAVALPAIRGLATSDPSLLGIVVTHGHPDHYGLIDQVPSDVPLYMGEAASRILAEAEFFTGVAAPPRPKGFLGDGPEVSIGPFTLTPFLVDHSAFDAYALLVEADGRRLLYTGDLRAHGRKARTFERLVGAPPNEVDVLLMEGTTLGRIATGEEALSEKEVEDRLAGAFRATEGIALVCFSPQNIDRYVSVYRAAVRSDRDLVVDLYADAVARATGRPTIPRAGSDRVRVLVPQSQRIRVKQAGEFGRVDSIRGWRIFPEELARLAKRLVIGFRPSMSADLERTDCLEDASAVWSLWPGYLEREGSERLARFLERNRIPLEAVHASGHASVADLQRLAAAFGSARLVPIHTDVPERFAEAFGRAEPHRDGEWWEV